MFFKLYDGMLIVYRYDTGNTIKTAVASVLPAAMFHHMTL